MMEYKFDKNIEDTGYTIKFKEEANILLASLNEEDRYGKYQHLRTVLPVIEAISNTNPQVWEDISSIMSTINKFYAYTLLAPLTLKDDEFGEPNKFGIRFNKRYGAIYKDGDDIGNDWAFDIIVRKSYDNEKCEEVQIKPFIVRNNRRIYLSKGGVITGEYIQECIIPKKQVEKGVFSIQSVINIPVSRIVDGEDVVYIVDHREPKLKLLREFYDVEFGMNDFIHDKKYNIRKYKKL